LKKRHGRMGGRGELLFRVRVSRCNLHVKEVSRGGVSPGGSGDKLLSFVQGVDGSLTRQTDGELILLIHADVVQFCLS
jgi:hypothetical protein